MTTSKSFKIIKTFDVIKIKIVMTLDQAIGGRHF